MGTQMVFDPIVITGCLLIYFKIFIFVYVIRKIIIPVFSKASALDVFSLSDNFIFSLVGLLFCFSTIKRKKYFIWLT